MDSERRVLRNEYLASPPAHDATHQPRARDPQRRERGRSTAAKRTAARLVDGLVVGRNRVVVGRRLGRRALAGIGRTLIARVPVVITVGVRLIGIGHRGAVVHVRTVPVAIDIVLDIVRTRIAVVTDPVLVAVCLVRVVVARAVVLGTAESIAVAIRVVGTGHTRIAGITKPVVIGVVLYG
jgi:hypothetical protein